MIRLYESEVEAATALAPPEVVAELVELGFVPTTGIDLVSQNRIGNLLAMGRIEDDVIAFVTLAKLPTVTFGSLCVDGSILFTSNSPHESVSFPRIGYTSQKLALPLPELLAQHLEDLGGRALSGHTDPDFAMALQRRHAEINEARRRSALWGLRFINIGALAAVVGTTWFYFKVLVPMIASGLSSSVAVVAAMPAAVLCLFALGSNFGTRPYGRPLTQYIGLTFGAGLPARTVEETLALGDIVETGR